MDNDDRQIGRILHRREVLALLGAAGGAGGAAWLARRGGLLLAAATPTTALTLGTAETALAQTPSCVVKPELTEGPYFVDDQLDRSDIRGEPSDGSVREGVPFALTLNVSQLANGACTPLSGARVDVWHCDALGVYSGVADFASPTSTIGQTFLRGYQTTGDDGAVHFTTIYPGWYPGRAVHIHFKIRTVGTNGSAYEFTSQFFLDDALSDQVFTQSPYTAKGGTRMRNTADGIYSSGGDQLLLNATPASTSEGDGYAVTFALGLDLSDTAVGAADGNAGGGPGGPGGRFAPGGGPPPRR
ncbi:MAG TPA: intradiol ring-cleavage dioxygenase [Acetobacteraceae bacterium]|jgi:protocatechuate 3,4-dioxygenase beta subunit|nr:intradiol ring-cleavage dioxygenase [Acetobacteraceae bacterium]